MRILAVDLGKARTGLAVAESAVRLASPVGTVNEHNEQRLLQAVTEAARREQAQRIVVGHPRNMDGSCGESAQRAAAFAEALRESTGLEVVLWDERMTTVTAIGYLNEQNVRGKKRKAVVDTVAATVILQNYLDSLA